MTEADMIAELEKLQIAMRQGPEGALTTREWCEKLNVTEKAMRDKLKLVQQMGRLERIRVYREDLRGAMQPVTAYQIKVD
jgi:hypothetical protein